MPTRKLDEKDKLPPPCAHPEHNPPSHRVFEPGLYEHECPACKHTIVFRVNGIFL